MYPIDASSSMPCHSHVRVVVYLCLHRSTSTNKSAMFSPPRCLVSLSPIMHTEKDTSRKKAHAVAETTLGISIKNQFCLGICSHSRTTWYVNQPWKYFFCHFSRSKEHTNRRTPFLSDSQTFLISKKSHFEAQVANKQDFRCGCHLPNSTKPCTKEKEWQRSKKQDRKSLSPS